MLAIAACGAVAGSAAADSIVYERDGNIWQARPDGSDQRQVTVAGGYSKPTQADDGTIVAVKDKLLHRMDRGGRILNLAGEAGGSGPLTPQLSPQGLHVAYNYFNPGPVFNSTLSHSTGQTAHEDIFYIDGWSNPTWIGNDRVLMFEAGSGIDDTLIYTLGGSGTQTWFRDLGLELSGGEIDAGVTRLAATDGATLRLYTLTGPPPAPPTFACDFINPTGSFFRPTWSPDGGRLAWQEDDGIWVADFCAQSSLVIPGGKAPDWGPADVSSPPSSPGGTGGPGPGGSAGPDVTAPVLGANLARRATRAALLRGLIVRVTCSEACTVSAQLLLDRRTARRLGLAAATVTIGRASKRLAGAGSAKLRLRPSAQARRRLRRGRLDKLTIRLRAADKAGNRSKLVTKKVAIRG